MLLPEELQVIVDSVVLKLAYSPMFADKKVVIIMRGVPGSGLSTVAKAIAGNHGVIHSTDYFFTDASGKYIFDGSKLTTYHKMNYDCFLCSIQEGKELIIIDNTNIMRKDFRGYVDAANANGYVVAEVWTPLPDPEVAAARNLQGVPLYTIERMIRNFEK